MRHNNTEYFHSFRAGTSCPSVSFSESCFGQQSSHDLIFCLLFLKFDSRPVVQSGVLEDLYLGIAACSTSVSWLIPSPCIEAKEFSGSLIHSLCIFLHGVQSFLGSLECVCQALPFLFPLLFPLHSYVPIASLSTPPTVPEWCLQSFSANYYLWYSCFRILQMLQYFRCFKYFKCSSLLQVITVCVTHSAFFPFPFPFSLSIPILFACLHGLHALFKPDCALSVAVMCPGLNPYQWCHPPCPSSWTGLSLSFVPAHSSATATASCWYPVPCSLLTIGSTALLHSYKYSQSMPKEL